MTTTITVGMRRPWVRAAAFTLAAALFVVVLAACGQAGAAGIPTASDNPGAAPAGATPTPTPVDEMDMALAYAQCIRENGVPEWPDPNAQGQFMITRDNVAAMNDPRRIAAMEACQHLRPAGIGGAGVGGPGGAGGFTDEEQAFAFARCMRENGVPDFPDPGASGGGIVINPGQGGGPGQGGINANDPRFQAAMETCRAQVLGGGQ